MSNDPKELFKRLRELYARDLAKDGRLSPDAQRIASEVQGKSIDSLLIPDSAEQKGRGLAELKEEVLAKGGSWLYAYSGGFRILGFEGYTWSSLRDWKMPISQGTSEDSVHMLSHLGLKGDHSKIESYKLALNESILRFDRVDEGGLPLKASGVLANGSDEPVVELMYIAYQGGTGDGRLGHFIKGVTVTHNLAVELMDEFRKHPDQVGAWFSSFYEDRPMHQAIPNGRILIADMVQVSSLVPGIDDKFFGNSEVPDAIKTLEKAGLVYTYEVQS